MPKKKLSTCREGERVRWKKRRNQKHDSASTCESAFFSLLCRVVDINVPIPPSFSPQTGKREKRERRNKGCLFVSCVVYATLRYAMLRWYTYRNVEPRKLGRVLPQ